VAQDLEGALRDILSRGVQASEALVVRKNDQLTAVLERQNPNDWSDESWEFANQRGLIPAELQAQYEMRLLEKRHALERAAIGAWQGGNNPTTGTATVGVASGQIPATPAPGAQGATLVQEVSGAETEPVEEPYTAWKVPDLQDEVKARNEQRPDESTHLKPKSAKKEDLVSALEADDAKYPAEQ
jgi:hypothetical protein